jgi:hypothetical protein
MTGRASERQRGACVFAIELGAVEDLKACNHLLVSGMAEEDVADNLLTQLARELMSQSRTGMTKEPKRVRVTAPADDE